MGTMYDVFHQAVLKQRSHIQLPPGACSEGGQN